jgi:hypothetical protein
MGKEKLHGVYGEEGCAVAVSRYIGFHAFEKRMMMRKTKIMIDKILVLMWKRNQRRKLRR